MKNSVLVALGMLASSNCMADSPVVKFSGAVQKHNGDAKPFSVVVPEGQTVSIDLGNGLRLELLARNSSNKEDSDTVRLMDSENSNQKLLHEAHISGSMAASPVFTYSVCSSGVRFVSPARAAPAPCP